MKPQIIRIKTIHKEHTHRAHGLHHQWYFHPSSFLFIQPSFSWVHSEFCWHWLLTSEAFLLIPCLTAQMVWTGQPVFSPVYSHTFVGSIPLIATCKLIGFLALDRLIGLEVKASSSRAIDPRFQSCLHRDFSGSESYQWLKNWHSSGYLAWHLALQGQCWDWLAWCQYTVTGWDGKFDLQLLSQCGST